MEAHMMAILFAVFMADKVFIDAPTLTEKLDLYTKQNLRSFIRKINGQESDQEKEDL